MIKAYFEKYTKLSIQIKAAFWFVSCSVLQKGISFITVPIFTRLLNPSEYGAYSLYLSWMQILLIFSSLNLYYGVLDNGLSKFDSDRNKFISSMQGLTMTITLLMFIVTCIFNSSITKVLGLSFVMIVIMFIEMMVQPALLFWTGRQKFEYRYKRLVFVTLLRSALNPLLGVALVLLFDDRLFGRLLSVVLVEVLVCGPLLIKQFGAGKTFYDKFYWKYALTLALPMLPHYLAGVVLNQGDRIMIERMVGVSEVAYYSVAYNIGMLVQMITSAINNAITPWLYGKFKSKNFAGVKDTINGLLVVVAMFSLITMLFSPELVLLFGSSEYYSGAYVIPLVAASVYFIFLYGIFSLPQFYFEKTRYLLLSSLFAAILNIVLNYFFIKSFGYIAAAYTTLVCYLIYSTGHYFISRYFTKKYMGEEELFDIKMVSIISLSLIACSVLSQLLFPYRIVRILCFLLVLGLIFNQRKQLLKLLANVRK